MQAVSSDLFAALVRWHKAYSLYDRAQCEPAAAAELVQASAALAASFEEMSIPTDQRSDVERWSAEGGKA